MRFAQENRILQGLLLYNNCKITSSKKLMVKFYENSKNSIWENFGHFLPIKGQNVYPNEMKKKKKKEGIRAQFSFDILQFNIGNYS